MTKLKFNKDATDKVLADSSARMNANASADLKSKADEGMAAIKADAAKPKASAPVKKQSFGEAFRAARAAAKAAGRDPDKETFMWGGQKKVARMASSAPAKKAPASVTPKASTGARGDADSKLAADIKRGSPLAGGAPSASPASKRPAADVNPQYIKPAPRGSASMNIDRSKPQLGESFGTSKFRAPPAAVKPAPKSDARAEYRADKAKRLKATMDAGRAPGASGYAKSRADFYAKNPDAFMKKGGKVEAFAKGGKIDGIAKRGLTRGRKK